MGDLNSGDRMSSLLANRYRVLSELGRGGMGVVYRGADTLHEDREVAIKVLQADQAITPELLLCFKEEFRAMTRLEHPNTIKVFDFGQLDERTHFLTMEIVPGQDLTELISSGLGIDQACDHLIQLLQALGFIHSRLYVHRDIKAANIRVRPDGVLKLMDFGLMQQLGLPADGKLSGSLGYLPPEVMKGGVIDASSDLYSVGCLAYEMLTGRLPFLGAPVEVVKAHMNERVEPVGNLRDGVPGRLNEIVMRLLEKDQKRRFQRAADVIEALAEFRGIIVALENREQKRSYIHSGVLVGRERELDTLLAGLRQAAMGDGRAIFVGAPAGIGKSRLVHELILQAKLDGAIVLEGRCLEGGMATYGSLAEALRPLVLSAEPAVLDRLGPVLIKICPELSALGVIPAEPLPDAGMERMRLNEAIVALLVAQAERAPLVLFLDDLHWCDPGSLETFNYCAEQLIGQRAMLIATFRNDETLSSSPVWSTIEAGTSSYLKLAPFNLAQMMMLIQSMLHQVRIGKDFSQYLYDATAGNAFFLTEVLRFMIDEEALVHKGGAWHFPTALGRLCLPSTIEATVVHRLSHLSAHARQLAGTCAIMGRYQDLELLDAVVDLERELLFAGLDELVERQFLMREDARYLFPHDSVREALYAEMPGATRQRIHQRCGEVLEQLSRERRASLLDELAYHFHHGADSRKAFAYLCEAGESAKQQGNYASAVAHWRDALIHHDRLGEPGQHQERIRLLTEIVVLTSQAWTDQAFQAYDELIPLLTGQGQVDQLIWAYSGLGICLGRVGRPVEGIAKLHQALDLLSDEDSPLGILLLLSIGICKVYGGWIDEAQDIARRVARMRSFAMVQDDPRHRRILAGALGLRGWISLQGLRPDEAFHRKTLEALEAIGDYLYMDGEWNRMALWTGSTGRYEQTLALCDLMDENYRKIGSEPYCWSIYQRATVLWLRGDLEEALALLERRGLSRKYVMQDAFAWRYMQILEGKLLLALGRLDEAAGVFQQTEQECSATHMQLPVLHARLGRGEVHLACQEHESAARLFEEVRKESREGRLRNPLLQGIACRQLARVCVQMGDAGRARELLDEALAIFLAPEQDNLLEQGCILQVAAELHLARGERDEAVQALDVARSLFEDLRCRHFVRLVRSQLDGLAGESRPGPDAMDLVPAQFRKSNPQMAEEMALLLASDPSRERLSLTDCLTLSQADEASLFVLSPGPKRVARVCRDPEVIADSPSGDLALVRQAFEEGRPVAQMAMPDMLAMDVNTLIAVEIPAMAAIPIAKDGSVKGVLFLVRGGSEPFEAEELALLQTFSQGVRDLSQALMEGAS